MATAPDRARQIAERFGPSRKAEVMEAAAIAQLVPQGASHQGLALRADPPEPVSRVVRSARTRARFLVILDHVTDPQNVGAIFRSAAAFWRARALSYRTGTRRCWPGP